jgi:hypothetical protein
MINPCAALAGMGTLVTQRLSLEPLLGEPGADGTEVVLELDLSTLK